MGTKDDRHVVPPGIESGGQRREQIERVNMDDIEALHLAAESPGERSRDSKIIWRQIDWESMERNAWNVLGEGLDGRVRHSLRNRHSWW